MADDPGERPLWLLVEGSNDRAVFEALLARGDRSDVRVTEYGGKTRLSARLRALAFDENFVRTCRWLGVVRDADDNEASTVQSIRDALTRAGLPSPEPNELSAPGQPMVQIIVIPGDGGPGELEDVMWRALVDDATTKTECVDQFLACARPDGIASADLAKARVYSYLAATTRPDRPLGATARASDSPLPMNSSVLKSLLSLLPPGDVSDVLGKR